jgi:hypothetical protein
MKRRMNLCDACYHLVGNHSSSRLLSTNIRIRIYNNFNFSGGSVMCVKLGLLHYGRNIERVFERRVLRRYLDQSEMK